MYNLNIWILGIERQKNICHKKVFLSLKVLCYIPLDKIKTFLNYKAKFPRFLCKCPLSLNKFSVRFFCWEARIILHVTLIPWHLSYFSNLGPNPDKYPYKGRGGFFVAQKPRLFFFCFVKEHKVQKYIAFFLHNSLSAMFCTRVQNVVHNSLP